MGTTSVCRHNLVYAPRSASTWIDLEQAGVDCVHMEYVKRTIDIA